MRPGILRPSGLQGEVVLGLCPSKIAITATDQRERAGVRTGGGQRATRGQRHWSEHQWSAKVELLGQAGLKSGLGGEVGIRHELIMLTTKKPPEGGRVKASF